AASDRCEAEAWFRELGRSATDAIARRKPEEHPLRLGMAALEQCFGTPPTTLVPPGDEFTDSTLKIALELGLSLVESYYLALREGDRFCWCQHVCAPYLDQADKVWFASGLPVVGYFHDYEPSVEGIGWMAACLDGWEKAGG